MFRTLFAVVLVLAAATAGRTDTVILTSGLCVEGIATQKGDKIEVRVPEGTLTFRRDVVRQIKTGAGPLNEYDRRLAALGPKDAAGHYQLALYCETHRLDGLAKTQLEQTVKLDPAHAGAHRKLGHTLVGKEWLCEFDYQQSRGNVRMDGVWLTHDLATARTELRRVDSEARAAAVEAYLRRMAAQEDEERPAAGMVRTCDAVASAKTAGPWLADALWPAGSHVKVAFGDGTPALWMTVQAIASEWSQHANLDFDFAPATGDASHDDIRVTFAQEGSWSRIGRQSLEAARAGQPSMCLNPITHGATPTAWRRTVLHEFGHALGMLHEHQNPNRTFHFNEQATRALMAKQGMSAEQIDTNLFATYGSAGAGGKQFDPASIMLYALPPEATVEGVKMTWNTELSSTDKQVAAALYPGRGNAGALADAVAADRAGVPPDDNRDIGHLTAALAALERDHHQLYDAPAADAAAGREVADRAAREDGHNATLLQYRAVLERKCQKPGRADRTAKLRALAVRFNAIAR